MGRSEARREAFDGGRGVGKATTVHAGGVLPEVAVVRNGRAELVPVKLGRDYGRTVEVVAGLTPADAVILDPADSLVSGTAVRVRPSAPSKTGG